jgi:hypothetical protein
MAPRQKWFETLRLSIGQEHGTGWIVREIGATARNPIGRAQLTRIWENRTRSSVVMPLEWKATNATAILATVGQLRSLMEVRKVSLQDALGGHSPQSWLSHLSAGISRQGLPYACIYYEPA